VLKTFLLVGMSGVCIEVVFPTVCVCSHMAILTNQRFLCFLTESLCIVLHWIMIKGTETMIRYFFGGKVFSNVVYTVKYEQKSWNHWKCHLEGELSSAVFVFSKLRFGWRVSWYFSINSDQSIFFYRFI